jgi:hypothetical protein
MTLTTLLTEPSLPLYGGSVSTPAMAKDLASTLSVEISNKGSSRSTLSPTFLIQRTIRLRRSTRPSAASRHRP